MCLHYYFFQYWFIKNLFRWNISHESLKNPCSGEININVSWVNIIANFAGLKLSIAFLNGQWPVLSKLYFTVSMFLYRAVRTALSYLWSLIYDIYSEKNEEYKLGLLFVLWSSVVYHCIFFVVGGIRSRGSTPPNANMSENSDDDFGDKINPPDQEVGYTVNEYISLYPTLFLWLQTGLKFEEWYNAIF